MSIRTKQFQILTDAELVWKLMTDVYNHDETNGPAAPFFEYAIISSWLDRDYLRLNRFWLDDDLPVAFVFYENPVTSTYFVLRPGYEFLADEMIEYAEKAFPKFDEPRELNLLSGQRPMIEAALKRGYDTVYEEPDRFFDLRKGKLEYPLPEGYHFVDARKSDPLKSAKCPHELYQNVLCASISPSPHATYDYTVIIADREENYVCFSGMWWVPENKLAYMEPLCTVPSHQHRGLAAAALSRHDKVMRGLGAEIMTGGGNDFYRKIGYQGIHRWLHMQKKKPGQ